ncbi:hypothetical protein CEXT_488561 [Caerostris extrusa]|uniref:Uncharacterized protein n=1 Tax=Caerostris extrusa TaxID=172846 RepID=A0AAV4NTZ3_CAEEX|nr:hypothetical protein CEXT_488561 [Caerostris extrusa]
MLQNIIKISTLYIHYTNGTWVVKIAGSKLRRFPQPDPIRSGQGIVLNTVLELLMHFLTKNQSMHTGEALNAFQPFDCMVLHAFQSQHVGSACDISLIPLVEMFQFWPDESNYNASLSPQALLGRLKA